MNRTSSSILHRIPDFELDAANAELARLSPEHRIFWGLGFFGESAVVLSSMQKTSTVLHWLLHKNRLDNEILFVDTGYHFRETLELRDLFLRHFRLNIVTLYPALTPERQEEKNSRKLWRCADGQPLCCRLRKEAPFVDYMIASGKRLVIGGLRKGEGGRREGLRFLDRDPRFDGFRLYPLLDLDDANVDRILAQSRFPVHPLHGQGYPSIGCECCTTPVAPGEPDRAGRWRHLRDAGIKPEYCGINFNEGGGI